MNIPNICKECKPRVGWADHEGVYYEIVPCPRHALVDRLAEFLRRTLPVNLTADNISREEVEICELLAEYDAATFTANQKERM